MWINETLIKLVESTSEISKTTIYISDLRKIKFCSSQNNLTKKIDKIVSREFLENLLIIGTGIEQDKYIIINDENNIIPLLEDKNITLSIKSQIILPLWVDNELKGTLIISSSNRKLDDYDLELAKCIQLFIEESIINSINEEFTNKKEKSKMKSKISIKSNNTTSKNSTDIKSNDIVN